MIRHGWWHGVLMAALLGAASCTHAPPRSPPRYGDTGPDELVLVDARCMRSEDCTVVDAWDGDPCHCKAAWRAANVAFAERWKASRRGHYALYDRGTCAQCGADGPPPELALCINMQCVAVRRYEADWLQTQLAPYLSRPPASPCPEPSAD